MYPRGAADKEQYTLLMFLDLDCGSIMLSKEGLRALGIHQK